MKQQVILYKKEKMKTESEREGKKENYGLCMLIRLYVPDVDQTFRENNKARVCIPRR